MTRPAAPSSAWQLLHQVFNDLFRFIGALGRELRATRGRYFVIVVPVLWLVLFFLVPFLIVLKISYAVSDPRTRSPSRCRCAIT